MPASLRTTVRGLKLCTMKSEVHVNYMKVKFLPHSKCNCSSVTKTNRLMPSIEGITKL